MPVTSPIEFPRVTEDQMREIDYRVMGQAFSLHNNIGRLCDESVYQSLLAQRLRHNAGFDIRRESPVIVSFGSFSKTYRIDCVVANSVIYELKSVRTLTKVHESQLLNYLLLVNATRGKLINFRAEKVESRFVNTSLDHQSRKQYSLSFDAETDQHRIAELLQELLSDWGTGLSGSLYLAAILHELGGTDCMSRQLPMEWNGMRAGNQGFDLLDQQTALFVTTLKQEFIDPHGKHLATMLGLSPLSSAIWVNINLHNVDCRVISGRKMVAGR